jgi:hypothetical protein
MNAGMTRYGFALAVIVAATVGCAPLAVNWYRVSGFDARHYRTYAWEPTSPQPTGDPRLDGNRFFDERVRSAVDSQLMARGFEPRTDTRADLLVRYHATVTQKLEVVPPDPDTSTQPPSGAGKVEVFDAGTLVIDFIDARSNVLVWRGWAEAILDGTIDHQPALERRVDDAVARIMRGLVRGS